MFRKSLYVDYYKCKYLNMLMDSYSQLFSESETRDRRKQSSTPRKIENGLSRSNTNKRGPQKEKTFSAPMKSFLDEFDFEKNLALFDKQAVFEEIENSGFPKIVKAGAKPPSNYRYDENVINSAPVEYRQITVPHPTGKEYVAGKFIHTLLVLGEVD